MSTVFGDVETPEWRLARSLAVEAVKEGDFALAGVGADAIVLLRQSQALVLVPTQEQTALQASELQALWKARLLAGDLGRAKSLQLLFCPAHSHPEWAAVRKLRDVSVTGRGVECDIVDPNGVWKPLKSLPGTTAKALVRGLSRFRNGASASAWELQQEGLRAYQEVRGLADRLALVKPIGSYALFAACLAMFVWSTLSGGSEDTVTMLRFGANYKPLTIGEKQWWRLIGSMFLHAGVLHLVLNMVALLSVGPTLERIYGNWRFLCLYAVSGIGGSLLSVFRGAYVSVGASGALFGLFGAALVLGARPHAHWPLSLRRRLSAGMGPMIAFNLIYGLLNDGIDNAAHVGGLVAGGLFGWFVGPGSPLQPPSAPRRWVLVLLGVAPFLVELLAVQNAIVATKLQEFPMRDYRNPWGSVTVTLPALFEPHRIDGEDFFAGPGFTARLSEFDDMNMVAIDNPFFVNQIRSVKGQKSLLVSTTKIDGRTWLLQEASLEGILVFQGYVYIGDKAVKLEIGVGEGQKMLGRTLLGLAMESLQLRRHDRADSGKSLFYKKLYRRSAEELDGQGDDPELVLYRATALLETDAEREGKALLDGLRKKDPKNPLYIHAEAHRLRLRKDYRGSLALFDQLLRTATNDGQRAYANQARIGLLMLVGREAEAKTLFATLSRKGTDRGRSAVYNEMAWVLAKLGRFEEALPLAETCVELLEEANNLDTRGTILFGLGRMEEAAADFDAVLEKSINLGNTNFYMAKLLEQNDDSREEAVFFYYRYLLLDGPSSAHADEAREALSDLGEGPVKL